MIKKSNRKKQSVWILKQHYRILSHKNSMKSKNYGYLDTNCNSLENNVYIGNYANIKLLCLVSIIIDGLAASL